MSNSVFCRFLSFSKRRYAFAFIVDFQDDGRVGTITHSQVMTSCDAFTFDIVLGSDGDGNVDAAGNTGSHWDCWESVPVRDHALKRTRNPAKLGKHMGVFLWANHLRWAFPETAQSRVESDVVHIED